MSEIQRYEAWPSGGTMQPWKNGSYVSYADLAWYRRHWFMQTILTCVLIVVCAVLSALLVTEKASRGPVQVPIGAAERADMLKEREASAKQIKDLTALKVNYEAQIRHLNTRMSTLGQQIDIASARGAEIDKLNKEQAQRMSTNQGVVLEAKRVLGVNNVRIVER